jgi:cell wall-associated NlpC family hydrolase
MIKEIAKLKGVEYILGSRDDLNGLDCFTLVLKYLVMNDIKIPSEFEGLSVYDYNYAELFNKKPQEAIELAIRFLKTIVKEKKLNLAKSTRPGTILVMKADGQDYNIFGIDIGGGNVITVALKYGVIIAPKRFYKIERGFII